MATRKPIQAINETVQERLDLDLEDGVYLLRSVVRIVYFFFPIAGFGLAGTGFCGCFAWGGLAACFA